MEYGLRAAGSSEFSPLEKYNAGEAAYRSFLEDTAGSNEGLARLAAYDYWQRYRTGAIEINELQPVGQPVQAPGIVWDRDFDPFSVRVGSYVVPAMDKVNNYLEEHPGVKWTLKGAELGLAVAMPARYLLDQAVGKATEAAVEGNIKRFQNAGYNDTRATFGGVGGPVVVMLAIGGVSGALHLAERTGGFRIHLDPHTLGMNGGNIKISPVKAAEGAAGGPLRLTGPKQISLNKADAGTFQKAVQHSLRMTENRQAVTVILADGCKVTTIPDLWGVQSGVLDIKKVQSLSFTEQLRAQYQLALDGGQQFNLVVSPATKSISLPLQRSVAATGGKIFEFNPSTGSWTNVVLKGNKVVRP